MRDEFKNRKLPEIYFKNGKACYMDTIRNKLVYVTPEETVRQKVVKYLIEELDVPKELISIEDGLYHYAINSKRRADIIISQYDADTNSRFPLTIIECKAPDVIIGESAVNQGLDYAEALNAKYIMITNGSEISCLYWPLEGSPEYIEELRQKGTEWYVDDIIGLNTPESMISCITNLAECFIDLEHKFPVGDYGFFSVLEDYGVRYLSYGTAGGTFNSVQKHFDTSR